MGAIGATRPMSTTTWAMTLRAGTRKGSAAPKRTTWTATSPAMPRPPGSASAPRSARITAGCSTARGTAATRAPRAPRRPASRGGNPDPAGLGRGHQPSRRLRGPAEGLRRTGPTRAGPEPGQGQGQLVAALDAAEGPGRAAVRGRRGHRARRDRRGRGLRGDAGSHRGDGGHRILPVRGLLEQRRPHRPVRHHQSADADLRPARAVAGPHQRRARRRGPEFLQRGRYLAHRHRAGRLLRRQGQ